MKNNQIIVYSLVILALIGAFFCLPKLKMADDLSDLSSIDTSLYHQIEIQNKFFENQPKQAVIILENKNGWFNQTELKILKNISEQWELKFGPIEIASALTVRLPVKNAFSFRLVNPLENNDFEVETIHQFNDVYSKFFSKSGKYSLLYLDDKYMNSYVIKFFDETVQPYPQIKNYYHSDSMLMASINDESNYNFAIVTSVVFVLMILAFYFFVNSLKLLIPILSLILFQMAIVIFLLYFNDITITPQITTIPALVCVLSISDMLHISYLFNKLKEVPEEIRKLEVLKRLKWPLFLTSFTNCLGFIVIQILSKDVNLLAISWIGIISVIIAFLSSIFLFTCLLKNNVEYYKPHWDVSMINGYGKFFGKLVKFKAVTIFLVLVFIFFGARYLYGLMPDLIKSNSDVALNEDWQKSSHILSTEFYGNQSLTIIARSDVDILNDSIIKAINDLNTYIAENFTPFYIESYLNVLKRYNRFYFHGDYKQFELPKFTSGKLKEFNLIKNNLGWFAVVVQDNFTTKIEFGFYSNSIVERQKNIVKLNEFLEQLNSENSITFELTGLNYWQDKFEYSFIVIVLVGMIITFFISMIIIGIIKLSFQAGLIFMCVNLLPIFCALILMSWFNIPLNSFTVFMLTLLLGLSLDDSIYMILTKDKFPFNMTLFPVVLTTIILSVAMLGFSFSSYDWLRPFGFIFFTSFLVALLCDILILPLVIKSKNIT